MFGRGHSVAKQFLKNGSENENDVLLGDINVRRMACYSLQCTLDHINDERYDEPFPEIRAMEHEQHPKWHVQQVRPVENLKAAAPSNERLRTQEHDDKHGK